MQIAENGMEPVHLEWLHGHYRNARADQRAEPRPLTIRAHDELAFERTEHGLAKRRRLVGQEDGGEDWDIGQQLLFPSVLYHANQSYRGLQFRVPRNDESTFHVWWEGRPAADGVAAVRAEPSQARRPDGSFDLDTIDGQDAAVWESQ